MARKKKSGKIIGILVFVLIALALYMSKELEVFEKEAPQILIADTVYVNSKQNLELSLTDSLSGISKIKLSVQKDANSSFELLSEQKIAPQKELNLQISLPKESFANSKQILLRIEAKDNSLWNFFRGNETVKDVLVINDNKRPLINIISHSPSIEQGGAALVIFRARDENLDEVYIEDNEGNKFISKQYLKDGYYGALIAWDSRKSDFVAYVVAKDKAQNTSKERVRFAYRTRQYKTSNIELSDRFLDGKIQTLTNQYAENNDFTRTEKFKFINEELRNGNEKLIHDITTKIPEETLQNFRISPFLPLKNSAKVADFSDHRFYTYKGEAVSNSHHLGLDLASVAQAPILSSNDGVVVFADENGIYGLNVIIYHGFGLYSLYGHCTSSFVAKDDKVLKGDSIATTGVSGLALGDHLHFGILVQGVETRPEQWQDRNWLQIHIHQVLDNAKTHILGR